MADGGLRHLEALYHKYGGLGLPHSRRINLDSCRSAASTQPKKLTGSTQGIVKAPSNNEVIDISSDSDPSIASGLSNKRGILNSNQGKLEPEQSPIVKQVLSTSPMKSTRQLRVAAFPGPGSSPAAKHQRFSTSTTSSLKGRMESPGKCFDSPNSNNLEGPSPLCFVDEVPDNVQIGVVTDHKSLEYFSTAKLLTRRQAR
jgi:hypothetical protein